MIKVNVTFGTTLFSSLSSLQIWLKFLSQICFSQYSIVRLNGLGIECMCGEDCVTQQTIPQKLCRYPEKDNFYFPKTIVPQKHNSPKRQFRGNFFAVEFFAVIFVFGQIFWENIVFGKLIFRRIQILLNCIS